MEIFQKVPDWILRPLPINSVRDDSTLARIKKLGEALPASLEELSESLRKVSGLNVYDEAVNLASAYVWLRREQFLDDEDPLRRLALLRFAEDHMSAQAQARICRQLAKDPSVAIRQKTRLALQRLQLREVALPTRRDGVWDTTGWFRGSERRPLARHQQGTRIQEQHNVPVLPTIGALRELLGITSEKQLGYLLLASDADDGPYVTFAIPKRDGSNRTICAPKKQLRWVQRQILDKILINIPTHDAAHGFVRGRSIVTNAQPHCGAKVIVKFDLTEFFPTVYYHRVVGLFASLGYGVGNARFHSNDSSDHVAPTLARLCCYVSDPTAWHGAVTPQGAPTSPAISNLICRRLDARLNGLAKRNSGIYTRYADDLTFSFKNGDVDLGRLRWWVNQICHQEGFFINERKFRVVRASQRQVVTGIVVNDELRIPREERRRFRAILHNCRTKGLAAVANGQPRFVEWLRGFACYVHMVHPEEGEEFLRQVDELLDAEEAP